MDLMEDLDPEAARAVVDPALKLMIDAAHRYDGYIVQSTGDGIFALFGAPLAHEDHPQRALYAALRVQEEMRRYSTKLREAGNPPLEARVGVNTGEVVVRSIKTGDGHTEYTPIGHSTSLASRMQTLAPTGSIAVTEMTERLCAGYFNFKALGPTRVKGVTEPVNVFEVTGLGPLRTRLQRSAGRGLTKFVGREREMEAMRNAAELARAGRGQIVAAMAEAGTGKSRLFFEFKAKNQSGWMVLEAYSVSHGKASAYLPVLDLLHGYFKIVGDDDARTRREKVNGKVLTLDRSLEDALPYLFGLLGIVEGDDPIAQMDGQIKKRRTLEAIKRILLRESLNQPLMVIFEDLHWIDEETQALLNLLADSIGTAKILLLVNYRPEYSHQWNSKTYYTQLRLDTLGKKSAEEMLTAMVGDGAEVQPLKRMIIERTQGNPFFMEETVQVLLDEGALVRDGAMVKLTKPIAELKIPPTVQGILAARIDRLPADAKDLLQTLSVIGREFSMSLISAVVPNHAEELDRMLNELQLGEFIYEQPVVGDTAYIFKHALTQEVAHNSVLLERRKQMHQRVGEAIELLYADSLDDHLGELARHYSRGTDVDKAVTFLTRAVEQSLSRFAYAESMALAREGLALIEKLPESPQRDASELELASSLADASWRGIEVDAPETIDALQRTASLAEKTGNLLQQVRNFYLRRVVLTGRGDFSGAAALANRALELAKQEGSTISLLYGYQATAFTHFYSGDLSGAEAHYGLWRSCRNASTAMPDTPGEVGVRTLGALCAWMTGHINLSRERIAETTNFAISTKDPFALMISKWQEAVFFRNLGEPERVLRATSQTFAIAEENSLRLPRAHNSPPLLKSWALAHLGNHEEALALLRDDLAGGAAGSVYHRSLIRSEIRSDVMTLAGRYDEAMDSIQEALSPESENHSFRPDLFRKRGEIWLGLGNRDAAETDFREAIGRAQKMGAKSLELRATTSLARLLRDMNRREEARAMLAEIYGWFTEGFDTADLKDAKALLDELSA
jgi:class 3 adenylate cyclase/tetratricopeptide (TPR) repeat protein